MNGFAGFHSPGGTTPGAARAATAMAGGGSAWSDESAGLALAAADHAVSRDGRWVVGLDGGLANASELARSHDLADGSGDAAAVAEAIARWGIERGLQSLDGPFAVVAWDRIDRTLHLARDRFGERSLAWTRTGGATLFATGLAPLRRHPAYVPEIDRAALAAMLRLGFIPAPLTIHKHVSKVPPGTVLSIKGLETAGRRIWSSAERMTAVAGSFSGGPAAAAERLNQLLRGSISARLQSTGTVAVLLSGGAASSLVAAIALDLGGSVHPVALDEAALTDGEVASVARELPLLCDEPIAHPGQVAAIVLARAAARRSAVALTGEGAAQLLGGSEYSALAADWARLESLPPWSRRLRAWGAVVHPAWAECGARSPAALLDLQRSLWRGLPSPVPGAGGPVLRSPHLGDAAAEAMAADLLVTLPEGGCVLTRQAAAAAGIAIRRPFLDCGLAEFAWSLPAAMRADQSCLREAACCYSPASSEKPLPLGAEAPLERWLAGPLAAWAGDLLSEDRLRRQGLVDPGAVARCRRQGRNRELWAVLMLQAWLDAPTP